MAESQPQGPLEGGPGPECWLRSRAKKMKRTPDVFLGSYIVLMEVFDGVQLIAPIAQPLGEIMEPQISPKSPQIGLLGASGGAPGPL